MSVACCLSIGRDYEPYLGAFLRSIEPAVDALALNDNSGFERNPNEPLVRASRFARDGALVIVRTRFDGFAKMRGDALRAAALLPVRPTWILYADADEVHGEQLRHITRDVLPSLPPDVGFVDAYVEHFFGTFDWLTDVGRRLTFFRYGLDVRWEHLVHERLAPTVAAKTIVLPYVYNHYGNVADAAWCVEKNERYEALAVRDGVAVRHREAGEVIAEMRAMVRPFRRRHPRAARETIERIERDDAARLDETDRAIRASRTLARRLRGAYHATNDALRVRLRYLEHPGTYRARTIAR